jgi:hypothetical protein
MLTLSLFNQPKKHLPPDPAAETDDAALHPYYLTQCTQNDEDKDVHVCESEIDFRETS